MARYARSLSILSVLVLLLAGCGGGDGEGTGTQTATGTEAAGTPTPIAEETMGLTDGEQANFHGQVDASGDDTLELELDDNYFEPTVILGTAGQEITLEAFNEGGNIHNFSLPDQQIDEDFQEDAEKDIEVSFPDSGAISFSCKYHAELGMRGELRVA